MNLEPYSILIVLVVAMVFFIWARWRFDIVALMALAAATLIGAVPFDKVYSGLSNNAVITVACVMVISKAISDSGVIDTAVQRLDFLTKSFFLHVSSLCLVTAVLSAFMNNVGALALMMPVAIQTSIKRGRSPSLILMPLALASALGGLLTVIGTPANLLIADYRENVTGHPFTMFDYSHVGLVVAAAGVLFIILIGCRLIPERVKSSKHSEDLFKMEDYITEVKVTEKSKVIGKTIEEFEALIEEEYSLIGMVRKKRNLFSLRRNREINEGDILIVEASAQTLESLIKKTKLQINQHPITRETLQNQETALIETVVPPASRLEDRSARSMRLSSRYRISLLAIARKGKPFIKRILDVKLKGGDVVLLQGPVDGLKATITRLGFLPLGERNFKLEKSAKAYMPFLIFAVSIIFAGLQIVPVEIAFGGAVLVLALFNLISVRTMYDSINWPVIILLAAMIPIGNALRSTGGTAMVAHYLLAITGHISAAWVLVIVFVITMTLSDFMNNVATTVVMAPIAISIAQTLHVSVDPFLMAVAVAASCSFLTPVGHQNNTLVMGPGGYKFSDYVRVGLPLEIVVLLTAVPMILFAWPLS
jgi:di/tricarboxylate transporter